MREQTGALAPPSSDEHKVRHSRRQGIMASVFSGTRPHVHDVNLDLSVEMNRKMQSVLEDTLLKNITLKVRPPSEVLFPSLYTLHLSCAGGH